jgi:hypothetical protein
LARSACAGGREAQLRATPYLLAATVALAACGPRDGDARIARARAETRMLGATLDRLEDRLLSGQQRVHLWQELRDRHESVSAIACASQEEHASEMAKHVIMPRPMLRAARSSPPSRVAAAVSEPAKPLIRGSGHLR